MNLIGHILLVGAIFAVIDSIWLTVIANKFYKKKMGKLLADKPSFVPAVLFYVIYIVGVVIFALNPALGQGSLSYVIGHAALFGFAAYATYDLTNAATLEGWSNTITVIDLIWGTFVTTASAVIAFLILR